MFDNDGQGDSQVTSITYKHGTTTLGVQSYSYDADGRRSSVGGSLATVVIPKPVSGNGYNADNEATNFNGYALTYDSDGQTLTDPANAYTWDVRRHLTNRHMTGINYGADFVYDALGRRVKFTNEALGTTTQYLYDGLNPVALTAGTSATTMLTGLNIDEYFSYTNSTGSASLMTDVLGSIIALTDSTGAIFSNNYYEPFGHLSGGIAAPSSPLITIPFEFTAREDDDGTVYYYRARYYNSQLQRFLSQDPLEFAGGDTNLYGYLLNDPVNLVDPSGEVIPLYVVAAGIGGTIGAIAGGITAYRVTGGNWRAAGEAALVGFAAGALSTLPVPGINPLISAPIIGLGTAATANIAIQKIVNKPGQPLDWNSIQASATAGAIGGELGGIFAGAQSVQSLPIFSDFGQALIGPTVSGVTAGALDPLLQPPTTQGSFQTKRSCARE